MSVPPDRLLELQTELLPKWLAKKCATKTELQSLIGKPAFVSKCIQPGHLFLTRILDTLRSLRRNHHWAKLSAEFRKDIRWWMWFINVYNGVSLIPTQLWSAPDSIFSTDACLTGCGGMSSEQYFHVEFPPDVLHRYTAIHLLEALAIVIALQLWGRHWRGLRIMVHCDNFSVVSSLNSGRRETLRRRDGRHMRTARTRNTRHSGGLISTSVFPSVLSLSRQLSIPCVCTVSFLAVP